MASFIGEISCKLDPKGRILFPAAFKKQLPTTASERFVLKKDIFESCLVLYPYHEWERQVEFLRKKLNPYNQDHNRFLRGFFRSTAEVELDASNRMLLPKRLLDEISADKDLVIIGLDTKLEIWTKEFLDENATKEDEDFAELAQNILGSENLDFLQ
jgi:MraZ protein